MLLIFVDSYDVQIARRKKYYQFLYLKFRELNDIIASQTRLICKWILYNFWSNFHNYCFERLENEMI